MTSIGDLLFEFRERPSDESAEVLTLTEKNGFVRQADRFKKRLATEDVSNYKLVRRNDIAFNPYLLWAGAVAQNTIVERGVISPLYPTFRVRDGYDPTFVGRLLLTPDMIKRYDAIAFGSVPRRRRSAVSDFLNLPISPPPPIDEQRRIAAILDFAEQIHAKVAAASDAVLGLTSRSFDQLFPANETHRVKLSELADINSGITIGRKLRDGPSTTDVPYLAVSNVKDRHLNLNTVKTVSVTAQERAKFELSPGDLLLTEGGDPDKLGRGTLWGDEIPGMLHQNHIFRVRLKKGSEVSAIFLSWFTSSKEARAYFLRNAKQTTGIASINKTQLGNLPVAVPSRSRQDSFERVARAADVHAKLLAQRAEDVDSLLASLQARAFRGEL